MVAACTKLTHVQARQGLTGVRFHLHPRNNLQLIFIAKEKLVLFNIPTTDDPYNMNSMIFCRQLFHIV